MRLEIIQMQLDLVVKKYEMSGIFEYSGGGTDFWNRKIRASIYNTACSHQAVCENGTWEVFLLLQAGILL